MQLSLGNVTMHFECYYEVSDIFLLLSFTHIHSESAMEELHGIRKTDADSEHSHSINDGLRQLEISLDSIKRGTSYEVAETMDRDYVSGIAFRMMFLRANEFDPEISANHIIQFLDLKRYLFGQEKIAKKITLEDLDQYDTEYVKSGAIQISPLTDSAGRRILLFLPSCRKFKAIENELRGRYYTMMSMLESEETQKEGVVGIYYAMGNPDEAKHGSNTGSLWKLPLRWASFHGCVSDWQTYCLASVAIYCTPVNLRPKARAHCGSDLECLYKLASFGIPKEALPLSVNFKIDTQVHMEWYRERQRKEQGRSRIETDENSVLVPGPKDVLFGRIRNNGGNRGLRGLVRGMLEGYEEASKNQKTEIAEDIVKQISSCGGRFLKQNDASGWEEASYTEAIRKVAHSFRNFRRAASRKKFNPV